MITDNTNIRLVLSSIEMGEFILIPNDIMNGNPNYIYSESHDNAIEGIGFVIQTIFINIFSLLCLDGIILTCFSESYLLIMSFIFIIIIDIACYQYTDILISNDERLVQEFILFVILRACWDFLIVNFVLKYLGFYSDVTLETEDIYDMTILFLMLVSKLSVYLCKQLYRYRNNNANKNTGLIEYIEKEGIKTKFEYSQDTCSICLDNMEMGFELPCKHGYHSECLIDYVKISRMTLCPLCKEDFSTMKTND